MQGVSEVILVGRPDLNTTQQIELFKELCKTNKTVNNRFNTLESYVRTNSKFVIVVNLKTWKMHVKHKTTAIRDLNAKCTQQNWT